MSTEENLGESSGTASDTKETVAAASADTEPPTSPTLTKTKIDVLLKAAGDAPIMKKKKWTVDRNKKVAYITAFISKAIKLEPGESLMKEDVPLGPTPILSEAKPRMKLVLVLAKRFLTSFLYVNQSFAPPLDTEVGTVFDCFGSDGKLVLHYCKTQAWG